jgi:hypothetical protein
MKYLCLIYSDETVWEKLPKSEEAQMMAEYRAFNDSIKQSGHHVAGYRLHNSGMATTVRVRNGKLSTTDGPFVETKEQLGGYYLIEARDLNDAIQVAGRIPGARMGTIEVRPVWEPAAAPA